MSIKEAIKRIEEKKSVKNPIIKLLILVLHIFLNIVRKAKHICYDADYRSIMLMQLLNSKNVHQTTSITFMDRYPEIFLTCRDYLDGRKNIKILSYGCSTGEEVLTLRKHFPNAEIIGAEINKRSLSICKKLEVDKKVSFVFSSHDKIKKYGPFDAIFCMAVLQRTPHYIAEKGITSLKKIYPFEKFEHQVIELDKLLNPQGLLIIQYTQYSLWDTAIASKYEVLGDLTQNSYISPIFDRNSNLISSFAPLNSIFIKLKN